MEASKYILSNLLPGEDLVQVFVSSKGLFGGKVDIALTDQRIFGRLNDGEGFSLTAKKIKNVEIKPGGFFSGKPQVIITGPYKKQVIFQSEDPAFDRNKIIKTLKLKF